MNQSNPQSDSSLTVQTINSKGDAPKRRIATPQAALTAYMQAREIERRRDLRFNAIMGIYNGFPPTPPEQMDEMGLGDMPNTNCKQFQNKIDTYVSNWNSVNAAGSDWFEVRARHDDPMEAERRSRYLTKCFNLAVKQWDGTEFANGRHYVIKSATRDTQMGLFGIGVSYFADPIDFRWKVRPTRKVLLPEGVNLLLDNCPALFIEDEMSVPDMWAMRDKPGWDKDAITALLYLNVCQYNQTVGRQETLAEWTERIRENDTWMYSDFPLVKFVHVYVKEFGSTPNKAEITHCIITDAFPNLSGKSDQTTSDFKDAQSKAMGWLYCKEKVAERWSQILVVFSDNAGPEEKWHGVKGYGDLIFDGCHFNNLMFNRTATSAIVNNMLMFKGGNEQDRQKMAQVKITPFAILAPGLELEQVRINTDISSALAMFDLGTNIVNTNSRQFPGGDQKRTGEAPTATQVNFDRADEARFTNLQVMFYRATGLDCLGSEMYRRLAQPKSKYPESWPGGDIAKEFRERCKDYGIPEDELLDVEFVRANRSVGTGNMGLDVMRADGALQVATPGQGQLNARKLKITALYGSDMVPALVEDVAPPPNYEDVVIDKDNLNIQSGQVPLALPFQPHEKHLGVGTEIGHVTLVSALQQTANQLLETGIEADLDASDKIYKALIAGIEHCNQHVAFMSEVPLFQEQVKELNKLMNDLGQFAQAFGESLQAAQEQANPQAQMTPEQMKAQSDIQISQAKAANDIEISKAKALAKMENDQVKAAVRSEQTLASHEMKMGLTAQQKALELESQAAMKQMDLQSQQASAALNLGTQAVSAAMTSKEKQAAQQMEEPEL